MDNDDSNLDIAIIVGNDIRIRTECSGRSNDKVMLCLAIQHLKLELRYAAGKKERK